MKHDRVIAAAEAADPKWDHEVEISDSGVTLNLTRGDESMQIVWGPKTELVHPLSYSLKGVREVKLRNVSGALAVIAGKPKYTQKRTAKARVERTAPDPIATVLPFDISTATDEEIIKAVRGRTLTWYSSMSDEYETATVPDRRLVEVKDSSRPGGVRKVWRTSKNISVKTTSAGRRVLTFPAVNEQFRSLGLDTLVQVN